MAFQRSQEGRINRFVAKVDCHGGNIHHCWPWQGAKIKTGYGAYGLNRKVVYAHRLAWEIWRGEIPERINVCHHCDNPSCCNPHHLFLGTDKDNADDKVRKGRAGAAKGEDHHRAKLTGKQVLEIRRRYSPKERNGVQLAREFGIGHTTLYAILNGVSWRVLL